MITFDPLPLVRFLYRKNFWFIMDFSPLAEAEAECGVNTPHGRTINCRGHPAKSILQEGPTYHGTCRLLSNKGEIKERYEAPPLQREKHPWSTKSV